ncbi:MAG: hypothetical protein ACK5LX_16155 [Oscillospiraceae bacterium]
MAVLSSAIASCYEVLAALRLYALEEGSLIDAELSAYDEGFRRIEEKLRSLEEGAFLQTAQGEKLAAHERLVGVQERPDIGLAARRLMVESRLAVKPSDFYVNKVRQSLLAVGMDAIVAEDFNGESLRITVRDYMDPTLDLGQAERGLEIMLPAHLEWTFNYGVLTWDMLEERVAHWNYWDSKDFDWNAFDVQGDTVL